MIKKKVLALDDRAESKASTHVIIERDTTSPNPFKDYDQVFLLHSNIPRYLCGNEDDRNYDNLLVEIVDEDGYGTGEFRFRDGVIAFPVSAYIHSGIALRMGSIREFPCDPGGWDTTRNAAYLWTDKERFERMCCRDGWMTVYDEETKTRRPAKDEAEFKKCLWEIAKGELELFQKYLDGECFGFREETRIPFKRVYPDGREFDDCDWEDGDSCWGYYVDSIDDIEFTKDEDVDVFDATGHFVGDEWTIPELVIWQPAREGLAPTYLLAEGEKAGDGTFKEAKWTVELKEAKVFHSWHLAYNAYLRDGKRLWQFPEFAANGGHDAIKDKDELK